MNMVFIINITWHDNIIYLTSFPDKHVSWADHRAPPGRPRRRPCTGKHSNWKKGNLHIEVYYTNYVNYLIYLHFWMKYSINKVRFIFKEDKAVKRISRFIVEIGHFPTVFFVVVIMRVSAVMRGSNAFGVGRRCAIIEIDLCNKSKLIHFFMQRYRIYKQRN